VRGLYRHIPLPTALLPMRGSSSLLATSQDVTIALYETPPPPPPPAASIGDGKVSTGWGNVSSFSRRGDSSVVMDGAAPVGSPRATEKVDDSDMWAWSPALDKEDVSGRTFLTPEIDRNLARSVKFSGVICVHQRIKLSGFKLYIVPDWLSQKVKPFESVVVQTGNDDDTLFVAVFQATPPVNGLLQVYLGVMHFNPPYPFMREVETEWGSLVVCDLQKLSPEPEQPLVAISGGDFDQSISKVRVLLNLIRLGCRKSGTVADTEPSVEEVGIFYSLYEDWLENSNEVSSFQNGPGLLEASSRNDARVVEDVTAIVRGTQTLLRFLGLLPMHYAIDGVYGESTKRAVSLFQHLFNTKLFKILELDQGSAALLRSLPETGTASPATLHELHRMALRASSWLLATTHIDSSAFPINIAPLPLALPWHAQALMQVCKQLSILCPSIGPAPLGGEDDLHRCLDGRVIHALATGAIPSDLRIGERFLQQLALTEAEADTGGAGGVPDSGPPSKSRSHHSSTSESGEPSIMDLSDFMSSTLGGGIDHTHSETPPTHHHYHPTQANGNGNENGNRKHRNTVKSSRITVQAKAIQAEMEESEGLKESLRRIEMRMASLSTSVNTFAQSSHKTSSRYLKRSIGLQEKSEEARRSAVDTSTASFRLAEQCRTLSKSAAASRENSLKVARSIDEAERELLHIRKLRSSLFRDILFALFHPVRTAKKLIAAPIETVANDGMILLVYVLLLVVAYLVGSRFLADVSGTVN
jgi:hypothetical protein